MSFKLDLSKYKPRKEQIDTIKFIEAQREKNPLTKYFLLNLPTGVGKSHLALMLVDWYRKNVNKMARVDVITNSKLLQEMDENTLRKMLKDAIENNDNELEIYLKELLKNFKTEEVVTIEDWNKY